MRGAKQNEEKGIFFYIGSVCPPGDVGSGYFLGFKILNFNILGGFQKTEYF